MALVLFIGSRVFRQEERVQYTTQGQCTSANSLVSNNSPPQPLFDQDRQMQPLCRISDLNFMLDDGEA